MSPEGRRRALAVLGAVLAVAAVAASAAPAASLPLVDGQGGLGAGWRVLGLPHQSKPFTRFTVERVGGRDALRVEARASYGNLVHELPAEPAPRLLRWAWRMQQPNAGVDLGTRSGDDAAVKVCLSFDLPLEAVPFVERQLLRLARSHSDVPLPAATLCWVWGHREARGELIENAFTRRVRFIVLRNADDEPGRWFDETRDVAADFRRAFGSEAPTMPAATAVIISADADGTGGHSVARVAALQIEP